MTHKHGRVDLNQPHIVATLRAYGAAVTITSDLGHGVSDLLVSYRGKWFVIEEKSVGGKLTPDETRWIESQNAPVYVVYNEADALRAIGAI